MKKAICTVLFSALVIPLAANAKYNPPKDAPRITYAQKIAVTQMNSLDADGDGKLSREEFTGKVTKYTRTEEKNARRARKKGIYQTPTQQFEAADKDDDDFLTFQELSNYIAEYQKLDKGRARYY